LAGKFLHNFCKTKTIIQQTANFHLVLATGFSTFFAVYILPFTMRKRQKICVKTRSKKFKVRQAWQNKKLTSPSPPSASFVPQPAENNTYKRLTKFFNAYSKSLKM
jgi:hypothetical protein